MADDNQVAPAAIADNADKTVPNTSSAASSASTSQSPTDNGVNTDSAFDPRTSYDGLKSQFENLNKSYSEIRRAYTQSTQGYSDLKKQMDQMVKALSEATKEEVSPEDFMKSLQSQGVKAFDPLRQQWTSEVKSEYEKALEERDTQITQIQTQFEVMRRELDATNYPDFAKLKPIMNELANSENCPVDFNQPIGIIYDALYKLAKTVSAEQSVKEAHSRGIKDAEARVAKEAGTAVATGGKAGSMGNPADIKDLKKLREYYVSQLGEAD